MQFTLLRKPDRTTTDENDARIFRRMRAGMLDLSVPRCRDAVRAYTHGSAYAAFSDDRVGTLEAGKLADLAVLSQDIFRADPLAIGRTRVTMTMVGGKIVYRAE